MNREPANTNLRRARQGWEAIEAEEERVLRQMMVQESLRHLLTLQQALEPQFQQTEHLFRAERLAYLEELQRRLAALEERRREKPL